MNGKWSVERDGKITIHEFHDNILKRVTIKIVQNNLEEKPVIHVFYLKYDQGICFGFLNKLNDLDKDTFELNAVAETYNRVTTKIVCGINDLNLNKSNTVYLVLDDRFLNKGDYLYGDYITYRLIVEEKIQEMIYGSLYKLSCKKVFDVSLLESGKMLKIKRS